MNKPTLGNGRVQSITSSDKIALPDGA